MKTHTSIELPVEPSTTVEDLLYLIKQKEAPLHASISVHVEKPDRPWVQPNTTIRINWSEE